VKTRPRVFTKPGKAYSIGFDTTNLTNLARKDQFELVKCIYDPSTQQKLVDELLKDFIPNFKKSLECGSITTDYLNSVSELHPKLFYLAPSLKDPSFQEEQEWRLFSHSIDLSNDQIKFREGTSMIIPYYDLKLESVDIGFPISEVIIGPTPNKSLSFQSTKTFLKKNQFDTVKVTNSIIPYREW